jgi:predicted RNase H-like HicB family nuclease
MSIHQTETRRNPFASSTTTGIVVGFVWDPFDADMPAEDHCMKFQVTIARDEDGAWIVECPAIPGCVSQGSSRDEAIESIREAIRECLEVRSERGMPLTVEVAQVEVLA